MNSHEHRQHLVRLLRMAYSGEKAAGYAYNAHWKSVRCAAERESIRIIEEQEWDHRMIVRAMLQELNAAPQKWREIRMTIVGKTVGFACYLIGWFLPMYFAGRLEHANVNEYNVAADHAQAIGLADFARALRRLGEVELEHEHYFLDRIAQHPWTPFMQSLFGWGPATATPFPTLQADPRRAAAAGSASALSAR